MMITSYLPDNSYLVFAKPDAVKRVTNLATWVGDFRGEHKVSGDFVEGLGREFELEPKTATNVTEVSTFFDVHLPHNLGKLKLRSCRGKRLSEALTDTLCQKAKSRARALACFPASSAKVVVRVAPRSCRPGRCSRGCSRGPGCTAKSSSCRWPARRRR